MNNHPFLLLALAIGSGLVPAILVRSLRLQRQAADARAAQERAFTAAHSAYTLSPKAPAAVIPGGAKKYAAPKEPATAKAARIRASRRDFLMNYERWSNRQEVAQLEAEYCLFRRRAEEGLILRIEAQFIDEAMALEARRNLESGISDLTQLLPEAKKEWDDWEAKNWNGYSLWKNDSGLFVPDTSSASAADRAAADFMARCIVSVRPLLDEMDYLSDLQEEWSARVAASPAENEVADELRKRRVQARERAQTLADTRRVRVAEAAELLEAWEAVNWEGYIVIDNHPPTAGADHPLQEPPFFLRRARAGGFLDGEAMAETSR